MLAQLFGDRVKYYRKTNLLKQKELAHEAGICEQYLSRIEQGQVSSSFIRIENICRALKVEPLHLFFFHQPISYVANSSCNKSRNPASLSDPPSNDHPPNELKSKPFRLNTLPTTLHFIGTLNISDTTQAHQWSPSVFRLLGYSRPVAPSTKRLLRHIPPGQRQELQHFLNEALLGVPPRDLFFPFVRSTGRNTPNGDGWLSIDNPRWALIHAEPLIYSSDDQKQLNLVLLDVTDMLLLEQCLIRLQEELEIHLTKKTGELARTMRHAQAESVNRTRLERELRRFQRTISASRDAQAFVDRDFTYRIVNDAYLKLHEVCEEQVLGRSAMDIHGREVFARDVQPYLERAFAGEFVSTLCWKDVPGTGQRLFLTSCTPYRDESGISGLIITLHDVTEQHFLKNRLEFTESKYQTIVELANEGIRIVDDQAMITFANPQAAAMLGYDPEELEGHPLVDFIHPEDVPTVLENLEQRRHGACGRYEIRQVHRTGRTIWVRVSACPLYDHDTYTGSLATITDITADKTRDREMRCLQQVVARSPAVAFVWRNDAQWSVEYVSENVEQLLGWKRVDFLAGNLSYAELIHPEDRIAVKSQMALYNLDLTQTSAKLSPYRIRTRSGKMLWVEEMTTFLRSEDGQVQGYEGIIHDVTLPKLREDIILDSNTELTTLLHHCRQTLTQAQILPQGCPEIGELLDALRERLERYEQGVRLEMDDGVLEGEVG